MNRYKGINPDIGFANSKDPEALEGLMIGGIVLDRSPQDLDPVASPDLDRVFEEDGGLRQAYGNAVVGTATPRQVIALGEHRFVISGNEIFTEFYRAYQKADGYLRVESWDGAAWIIEVDSLSQDIAQVLLAQRSYFDAMFFADGEHVLKWDRSVTLADQEDDFSAANSLTAVGQSTSLTVNPGDAYLNNYSVHLFAEVFGPSAAGAKIVLALEHNGVEFSTYELLVEPDTYSLRTQTWAHEIISNLTRPLIAADTLQLNIKEVVDTGVVVQTNLAQTGGTPDWNATYLGTAPVVVDDKLYWHFNVVHSSGYYGLPLNATIGFYVDDGGGWVKVDEDDFRHSVGIDGHTHELVVAGFTTNHKLGIHIESNPGGVFSFDSTPYVTFYRTFSYEVHGFNKTVDLDDAAGLTYQTVSGTTNTLTALDKSVGTPLQGRYLGVFANRLVLLQLDQDPQKVGWCANGNPLDWDPASDGTGDQVLDSHSDSVDELMAFEALSQNTGALFRKRSIMRVAPTGTLEPALAFVPWVENLGTESPFSVTRTPNGLIFLGHDRMVYMISQGAVEPIGKSIWKTLKTITNPSVVEGFYDPLLHEYNLVLESETWQYDLADKLWHKHSRSVRRPALVGGSTIYYVGADGTVRYVDRETLIDGAYWTSPTLNRKNRQAEYSLSRVVLRYEADATTEITIRASGNGGRTWSNGYKASVDLEATDGEVRRAIQGFNVTGYDLRFRVDLPSDTRVLLRGWRAEFIERGQLGSE